MNEPQAPRARTSFAKLDQPLPLPNLIDIQKKSWEWFLSDGLAETIADTQIHGGDSFADATVVSPEIHYNGYVGGDDLAARLRGMDVQDEVAGVVEDLIVQGNGEFEADHCWPFPDVAWVRKCYGPRPGTWWGNGKRPGT